MTLKIFFLWQQNWDLFKQLPLLFPRGLGWWKKREVIRRTFSSVLSSFFIILCEAFFFFFSSLPYNVPQQHALNKLTSWEKKNVMFFSFRGSSRTSTHVLLITKNPLPEVVNHERESLPEGHSRFPAKKLLSLWNVRPSLMRVILGVWSELYLCVWINCLLHHLACMHACIHKQ